MRIKPASQPGKVLLELGRQDEQLLAPESRLQVKRILVPVDFSGCSRLALEYATALAGQFNAAMTLLHVAEIGSPGYEFGSTDFPKMETAIRQQALTELAGLCGEQIRQSIPIEVRVRSGWPFTAGKRPAAEIVQAAEEWAVDLVVMGTHGHTGLDHVFLGSTAERVVRHAPCPVLVVRARRWESVERTERSDEA